MFGSFLSGPMKYFDQEDSIFGGNLLTFKKQENTTSIVESVTGLSWIVLRVNFSPNSFYPTLTKKRAYLEVICYP